MVANGKERKAALFEGCSECKFPPSCPRRGGASSVHRALHVNHSERTWLLFALDHKNRKVT